MLDAETIRRLNAINRQFYATTAQEFDQTRGTPWPGWERLLPYLTPPLSVLDVGCGNGRFGVFLSQHLEQIDYTGVDNNTALLQAARAALPAARLIQQDIIETPLVAGQFDLIGVFGVIHHVPGWQHRRDFMRGLGARLKPGGLLALACWRFYDYERFRKRVVPWPDNLPVEAGDYLLDWRRGERALRYCHHVTDDELDGIVAASGLTEIDRYRADGFSGAVNLYSVMRRRDA